MKSWLEVSVLAISVLTSVVIVTMRFAALEATYKQLLEMQSVQSEQLRRLNGDAYDTSSRLVRIETLLERAAVKNKPNGR